ncbi:uncharacterized protein [Rutidosis leptorrhynchoides]|uniref:uncharacterized protein n=1 Tax=Rutidosis leptorrhynchoides TaxID=125765 RepID=UPI003A9A3635
MGLKGSSSKKAPTAIGGSQMSVTMREASSGKKHINTKSSLKLQHIKNLAFWASYDAVIPSLGAFYGHHLAASSEALVTPVDTSLFTCQRQSLSLYVCVHVRACACACESILYPGYNCTIRIEQNKFNALNKGKKINHYLQNNIAYTCHFCSHRNMKRGTPRNTNQPKVKAHPKSTNHNSSNKVSLSDTTKDFVVSNIIAAPLRPTINESESRSKASANTCKRNE